MKRTFRLLLPAALLVAPLAAQAMCYTIFDRKSEVLYRSDAPPFDLSPPTSVGIIHSRFSGGYLVIIPVTDECYPYGVLDRSTHQSAFEPKNYYKRLRGKE
jgi:hypothetical protein